MRIPQVRPVMVDAMTGAVRGEYVRDLAIPAGFNLAFGVWTPRGWRVVTDGQWLIFGPGSDIGIWEHDRFMHKFTPVEDQGSRDTVRPS